MLPVVRDWVGAEYGRLLISYDSTEDKLLSYQDTSNGPGPANSDENICSSLECPCSEDSLVEEDDRHFDEPKC